MKSLWSEKEAADFVARHADVDGDLALRTYSARLLGQRPELVLHGGGNTSVKGMRPDLFGEQIDAIYVKASGWDLAAVEPQSHPPLDLKLLLKLRSLDELSDGAMLNEVRRSLFNNSDPTPSLETPVHAFIPPKFIDHTHADAILTLSNQTDGEKMLAEALGSEAILLDYIFPGFELAVENARAFETNPGARGVIWMRHGIMTWGETARESYEAMIELVDRAEKYIAAQSQKGAAVTVAENLSSDRRYQKLAPVLRRTLALPTGDADRPWRKTVLRTLFDQEIVGLIDAGGYEMIGITPPLTSDHIIRTKPWPLWLALTAPEDEAAVEAEVVSATEAFRKKYVSYFEANKDRLPAGLSRLDSNPAVIIVPGLGAICAGPTSADADIAVDITRQTIKVKAAIAAGGGSYLGLTEKQLFGMEYRGIQHAKLREKRDEPLAGQTALITGAAGAIGVGVAEELARLGANIVLTDLAGERLESAAGDLRKKYRVGIASVAMDVSDPKSVADGFDRATEQFGGVDIVIVNAGLAAVASLEELDREVFDRLRRVNVDGALFTIAEAARRLRKQNTGGDIVLISTKNFFSPSARFGAYSATKAAAHQLARIAGLELAEIDVRVNMVSPDAVFSHGETKSGLWNEVGPDRMKARGLSAEELEEYYRGRNLLKAKITAEHVGRAVAYFALRSTPTTGATIPVDGGLPDASPR